MHVCMYVIYVFYTCLNVYITYFLKKIGSEKKHSYSRNENQIMLCSKLENMVFSAVLCADTFITLVIHDHA